MTAAGGDITGGGEPQYAELHAHTNFSFLDGASHPEEMAAQAAELGLAALAVTDHDGVYGAVRLAHAARAHGLKSIVGMEVTLAGDRHLTLLARDRAGYASICRLSTEAHRDRPKGEPELSLDTLSAHTTGLVALSGCRRGEIPAAALAGDLDRAVELATAHAARFEPGCFFLELQNHLQEEDLITGNALLEVAARTGLPVVATNNVHYHLPRRRRLQDVLTCIRHTETLATAGRKLRPNAEFHLKPAAAMAALFTGLPEALRNTLRIADMCDFDLSRKLEYGLPAATVPDGRTEYTHVEELVWQSVRTRYDPITAEVRERVERELAYTRQNDLAGYFLTVRDIVRYCHDNDILVNTRGSAPGSILCYALGISMVEPLSACLLFERFMSSNRVEPPDIDLDIEHQERERVIQYVYQRYGREHAAMVANVISYRGRSAIRDVGKALGLPLAQIERLARVLSWHHGNGIGEEIDELDEIPSEIPNRVATDLIALSNEIQNFPRHLGIHSGGMIISSRPLSESVPVEPATMEDRTVVQWDKDDCSDAGLIKIDLLGLGMMTLIHRAFRLIQARHGRRLELAGFTFDDPAVYDAACEADTLGVFQIESRAQIATLPRTRPRNFYDLVVEIAIIRPGPMSTKMHRRWILRRLGQEPITYLFPSLEPVLKRTLGLPIFQEQCMQMAMAVAGFSAAKADALRQAMSRKRSLQHIQSLRHDLISGMTANGVPEAVREEIYTQIEGYAGYGFPEAHSCAFALLVYVSTWLKVHYHAEFTCAILNSQPMGFYHAHTLIGDAQRHGVTVHPVDVRHSRYECTVEAGGAVRIGYRYVEGLGEAYQEALDREIESGPYHSLEDFCRRTRLPANILENLAIAGAFAGFGLERRDALWRIHAYSPAQFGDELPGLAAELKEDAHLRPAGKMVQARMDFAATGHSTTFRGMEFHRPALAAAGVLTATGLKSLVMKVRAQKRQNPREHRPYPTVPTPPPIREPILTPIAANSKNTPAPPVLDSIGAPRHRPHGGHPRSQTAATLHNALATDRDFSASESPPADLLQRYGGRESRVGNLYDGRSSGLRTPITGDAAIPPSVRARARTGVRVKVAGLVINRQRPGTAAGFTFLTLEDETGLVNVIINPRTFTRHKRLILDEPVLTVAGELEDEDGAIHVMAHHISMPGPAHIKAPPSNDWG